MKIAITSMGDNLESCLEPRFGRCKYFFTIDTETKNYKVILNEHSMAMGGAGIRAAEKISHNGVDIVITGDAGPNAIRILNAAGIQVITNAFGTINEVLEKFKNGELK